MISSKNRSQNRAENTFFAEAADSGLTIKRCCELLEIPRSSIYYVPKKQSPEELRREEYTKRRLDYWHTKSRCSGVRKLRKLLREHENIVIGRKLLRRYMDEIGIHAVYPKPKLSRGDKSEKLPYLLRNMNIYLPNQVWAIDITYIPMERGHMYLTAIIDWHSRYIVGWELSDSLDVAPVLEAVKNAISRHGIPGIINSDQGTQFTSNDYKNLLKRHGIRQSMDGKARWVDNVIIERWFRSLKTEYVYIHEYSSPRELRAGVREYIDDYNRVRPHQSHDYDTPEKVHREAFAA